VYTTFVSTTQLRHYSSYVLRTTEDLIRGGQSYGLNLRSVRGYLGAGRDKWYTYIAILALLLSKCTDATTLAFYYKDEKELPFGELANQIVRMIGSNQIVQFGLFSSNAMKMPQGNSPYWVIQETAGLVQLLGQILRSQRAFQALDLQYFHPCICCDSRF
jgi:hypothetical protein